MNSIYKNAKIRLVYILFLMTTFSWSLHAQEKTISLRERNQPLNKILKTIEQKTGYHFVYSPDNFPFNKKVNVDVNKVSIVQVLDVILLNTGFVYTLTDEETIVLKQNQQEQFYQEISGTVRTKEGNALPGVSINIIGTGVTMVTDSDGGYTIAVIKGQVLNFYYLGYKRQEIIVGDFTGLDIVMELENSLLDDVVVIGYGSTSRRLNTGAVSSVTAEQIQRQPVGNVLQALIGQVPGLEITPNSGYASGNMNITIRGQKNMMNMGSAAPPLYIIDGVPVAISVGDINNSGLNQNGFLGSNSGQSPLYGLSPADIESIEVLKDADATSIYGSRAANGVILITTKKKGNSGLDLNMYTGVTSSPRRLKLLNTEEYLQMRKEAFDNEGLTPDEYSAPDLVKWDPNRYTDWQKELGHASRTSDYQLSYSAGNEYTNFRLSGGLHKESPPVPEAFKGDFKDQRVSSQLSVNHESKNRKLKVNTVFNFSVADSKLPGGGIYQFDLAPNAPSLLNAEGKLNWEEYGDSMPYFITTFFQPYKANTQNLSTNTSLSYELWKNLNVSANIGYSNSRMDQLQTVPRFTQGSDPSASTGTTRFGKNNSHGWITEPRLDYATFLGKHDLKVMVGATLQGTINEGEDTQGSGYVNDNLLEDIRNATSIFSMYSYSKYKFQGYFARITYNYAQRYILNVAGRRDGSSRFRSDQQMGNFGSIGAAWIVSEEEFFKGLSPVISFAKFRASIGTTGSAASGDYQYLKLWQSSQGSGGYDGMPVINLYQPENPGFKWQVNKKTEAALELGFLRDRIMLSAAVYRELNTDVLVNQSLPAYTGFASVVANIPAKLENKGFEFTLNSTNLQSQDFNWTTSLNFSLNRNKLLKFDDLENSTYADQYIVGQPINIQKLLHYTGLDPLTGLYTFEDKNGNGLIDSYGVDGDTYAVDLNPSYTGAINNDFRYKDFSLSFSFDFKKQEGVYAPYNTYPGGMSNQPRTVLNRWKQEGDVGGGHKYMANQGADIFDFASSDGAVSNASYIRLQNVSFSYSLSGMHWLPQVGLKNARVYVQGQNLLIFSSYKGQDPTSPSLTYGFVPQRIFTGGVQFNF